jgi:hypothetical protein
MPLTFRRTSRKSEMRFAVFSHELEIGTIYKELLSGNVPPSWSWHLHVDGPQHITPSHGSAGTLDEAKAELERNWQAWLALAGLRE